MVLHFAMEKCSLFISIERVNPLPHMPILGSSKSAANKNIMSKIWTNGEQLHISD